MWIVLKANNKEQEFLRKSLIEKIGKNLKFYTPKYKTKIIRKNRFVESAQPLLKNYIFCYHELFNKKENLNLVKFTKGLDYVLEGYTSNQKQLEKFISYCKSFECDKGFIKPIFFKNFINSAGKFKTGPFKDLSFEVIKANKKSLRILIGNLMTTVSNQYSYIYRPI